MPSGGKRIGAGRKAFCPQTTKISWRVSTRAKDWIQGQAIEQGVPSGAIIDVLIDHFTNTISNE